MATLVFNTGTGSDAAASGAGPAIAITGTGAALAASTVVDLSADAPDLSAVATDGSAVLFVSTSSGRQFAVITAVDNGAKTVTVGSAYNVTESGRTWAIGGKRSTFEGSREAFLDLPNEIFETETDQTIATAEITLDGGTAIIRGANQTTQTILVTGTTAAAFHLALGTPEYCFEHLRICSTTGANGIDNSRSGGNTKLIRCELGDVANRLGYGLFRRTQANYWRLEECTVQHCINDGIRQGGSSGRVILTDCRVTDNAGAGVFDASSATISMATRSIFARNGSEGFRSTKPATIIECIAHQNGGSGFLVSTVNKYTANISSDNGADNVGDPATSIANAAYINAGMGGEITLTADPFTDAENGDFTLNDSAGGGAVLRSYTVGAKRPFAVHTAVPPDQSAAAANLNGGMQ